MKTAAAFASLILAFAVPACTSSPDDDLTYETDGGKEDAARPFGHFERELANGDAGFTMLDLREDRTYDASQELVNCEPGACTDAFSGTYKFAASGGKKYVVLLNEGDPWYSFEYKLSGETLKLRETGTTTWFSMTEVAAASALQLDDGDNNGSFDVAAGSDVVLKLSANATTGYKWKVTSTDRSFGYPTEDYVVSGPATGSGGTSIFTWKTTGPFPLTGAHSVTLEYRRPWETTGPAAKTFKFTVNVQ